MSEQYPHAHTPTRAENSSTVHTPTRAEKSSPARNTAHGAKHGAEHTTTHSATHGSDQPTPSHAHQHTAASRTRQRPPIFDRGQRPFMRGRLHSAAAWFFGGSSCALTCIALAYKGFGVMSLTTALYSLSLVGMLLVSALYHRTPWRSKRSVDLWRRADHAMIAIFIAATYGPITIAAFGSGFWVNRGWFAWGGTWMLLLSWVAALATVWMNLAWINHPRWLGTSMYLVLGWIAIAAPVGLFQSLGALVSLLILLGGVVYSLGAVIYAKKWPNPSEKWFGFHEVFHAATILAAFAHHIAMWLIVLP